MFKVNLDKCHQIADNIWAIPDWHTYDNVKPILHAKCSSFVKVYPGWNGEINEYIKFICPFN